MNRQFTKTIKMVKKQEILKFTINDMHIKTTKLLFFTYQIGNWIKIHSIQYCQGLGNGDINTWF